MQTAFLSVSTFTSAPLHSPNQAKSTICATISFPNSSKPVSLPTPNHRRPALIGLAVDLFRQKLINLDIDPKSRPVYYADFVGFPVTMVSELDTIHKIYKDSATFASRGAYPPTVAPLFGENSIIISDGSTHLVKRRAVLPAFAIGLIPMYFDTIVNTARNFWDGVGEKIQEENGATTLALKLKMHYLSLIIQVTSGLNDPDGNEKKKDLSEMQDLFLKLTKGFYSTMWGPRWDRAVVAQKELLSLYKIQICKRLVENKDIIDKMRAAGDDLEKVLRKDLKRGGVDMLTVAIALSDLETGEDKVHDEQVLKELTEMVLFIWFAGYSTPASSTGCCVMEMGMDKEIRRRLEEEQKSIMEKSGKELTFHQVHKVMPLLDSYMSEIVRIYPPAPTIMRKATRDVLVCGHLIKEGEVVGLDVIGSHRDAKYYSDPETLKIDRFMPGGTEPAVKIMSFGGAGGPHFCMGAALSKIEMKVTLATLLREYDWELDPKQKRDMHTVPDVIPASKVRMIMCERKEKS